MSKKQCAFCGTELTKGRNGTRAREHVFKKDWIIRLGHKDSSLPLEHFRGVDLQRKSDRPIIHFLAGEICNACNRGWMNELDNSVQDLIIGLAKGSVNFSAISQSDAFMLSRWTLKTAIAFIYADTPDRRHISLSTLRNMPKMDFLPDGFCLFAHQFNEDVKTLLAITADSIIDINPGVTADYCSRERLKFAIQYDKILFGCAYVVGGDTSFVGIPYMHTFLHTNNSSITYDLKLLSRLDELSDLSPFRKSLIGDWLIGLTYWSESAASEQH